MFVQFEELQKRAEGHQQKVTDDFTGLRPFSTAPKGINYTAVEETAGTFADQSSAPINSDMPINTATDDTGTAHQRNARNRTPLRYDAAEFVPNTRPTSVSSNSTQHESRQSTTEVLEGARDAVEKMCSGSDREHQTRQAPDDDWDMVSSEAKAGPEAELFGSSGGIEATTSTSSSRRSSFASKEVEGSLPKSVFQVRKPPLWRYVSAEVTHIDKENRKVYIVLWEDNELRKTIYDEVCWMRTNKRFAFFSVLINPDSTKFVKSSVRILYTAPFAIAFQIVLSTYTEMLINSCLEK